jgi:hypothetical protein
MIIIRNPIKKGFASLKLWVPIYHWKQRNVAGVAGLALFDAVETDFF